jgi:hypothetical protein
MEKQPSIGRCSKIKNKGKDIKVSTTASKKLIDSSSNI